MAAKAGLNAVMDELFDPEMRAQIDPAVWARIDTAATAGAEVAKVFEQHKGEAFLAARNPELQKRFAALISRQATVAAAQSPGFDELANDLTQQK